jgi:CysZ protein
VLGAIAGALKRALPILFTARVVGLATLPLLVSAVVWIGIAIAAWDPLVGALAGWLGAEAGGTGWQRVIAAIVAVLMFAAVAVATALAAVAILSMPVIVGTVASRHFPTLAPRHGGTFAGSARNALVALLLFALLWIVTLPLLVLPPVYAIVSLLVNGWLSQRMFRYDALAEHASADELATVLRESRARLIGLGLAMSPLSLIPLVNVFVLPLYAGIAYAELCLSELAELRARRTGSEVHVR